MKKLLTILLAALMASSLLVGCGAKPAAPAADGTTPADAAEPAPAEPAADEPITTKTMGGREVVTMWFWGANDWQREAFQKNLIDVFNNSQSTHELVLEYRNTVDNDIPVALSANSGPDIVYSSGPAFCNVYAQESKIIDLGAYSEKYGWKDRILPLLYDAGTIEGKLYSMPGALSTGAVFYNKALFKEKGWEIPKTVAEMEAIMDAAIKDGLYGSAAGNRNWRPCNDNFSSTLINHFVSPTNLYDSLTGAKSFNNPEMEAAIAKSQDWYKKGYLSGNDYTSLDSADCMNLVASKRAPFYISPSLLVQLAPNSFTGELANDLGLFSMPALYAEDKPVYDVSMACNFSINAASKCQDQAAAVIDIMMSPEFTQSMTEVWPGYWMMPLRDMSKLDVTKMTGISKTYTDFLLAAIPEINAGNFGYHPSTFFPPATQEAWRNIDSVWQEVMTPAEYLEAVEAEAVTERENKMVCPLVKPSV